MSNVYAIVADGEPGITKIGTTGQERPEDRLAQIQNGNPRRCRIAALFEGDTRLERYLHRMFADHRLAGEWFAVTADDVVAAVESLGGAEPPMSPRQERRWREQNPVRTTHCAHCETPLPEGLNASARYCPGSACRVAAMRARRRAA